MLPLLLTVPGAPFRYLQSAAATVSHIGNIRYSCSSGGSDRQTFSKLVVYCRPSPRPPASSLWARASAIQVWTGPEVLSILWQDRLRSCDIRNLAPGPRRSELK